MPSASPQRPPRDVLLWLTLACAAWLGATLGVRALALPDEGRYVGVAWEMLRAGDWTVPMLNGLPFFHKPPLFYWITAAALQVGGLHPATARVASWLAATATAALLYAFARRRCGPAAARDAVVVLVTLPLFYGAAQYANMDMLVAACIVAAVLSFAEAVLRIDEGRTPRAWLLAGWAAAALGVLAKGLIGLALPALVIGAWTLVAQGPRALRTWGRLLWWPGPVLFAALALPWFAAMERRFDGFLDYFVWVQHVRRFAAGGFNNAQPAWFYIALLPLLCLPWTPWAWSWRHAAFWRDPDRGPVRLLMAVWALVIVLFFSWPRSKMVGYVLPACVPLALLLAEAAGTARTRGSAPTRRAWRTSLVLAFALAPLLVLAVAHRQTPGSAGLAQAIAAERTPDEPVLFVDRYPYDLSMLAGIDGAWVVVDDWQAASITANDDWHRELADAARFAPAPARARLVSRAELASRLCGARGAWVVSSLQGAPAWLDGASVRARDRRSGVWHLDHAALGSLTAQANCPRTPNDAPAHR